MDFHRASAVHQVQRLATISHEKYQAAVRRNDEPAGHEAESPALAGYIVYVVTAVGFVVMCVFSLLH